MLTLIGDPQTELWLFYKHLTSMAIMDGRKIVLSIPLLRLKDTYEVHRVHTLLLPLCPNTLLNKLQSAMNLIATYNVETTSFLINKARSKYALLTEAEGTLCDLPETR